METIQKILVPIDFSDQSWRVLQLAAELCRKHEAAVTLLHVWDHEPVAAPVDRALYERQALSSEALSHLTRKMEMARHDLLANGAMQVDTSFEHGRPEREIVRFASTGGFSLVVMGTHGRTGYSHVLLGSVAERVVRRARCPVLTVHLGVGQQAVTARKRERTVEPPPSEVA
jgi:nucleotide-binding universal stress UspA family protein